MPSQCQPLCPDLLFTHHSYTIRLVLLSQFARWGILAVGNNLSRVTQTLCGRARTFDPMLFSLHRGACTLYLRPTEAAVVARCLDALWPGALPAENTRPGLSQPLPLWPCRRSLLRGLSLPEPRGWRVISSLASSSLSIPRQRLLLVLTACHGLPLANSSIGRGTDAALASAVFSTCRAPLSLFPTSPMCISSSCCLVNPHISSGIYWPLMIIRWNEMNKRMVNET